ncbi:restriction endonuclease subunit S [Sorangium sp. So ce1153]|uniref:restriction endonuclease subunit S n=1 Tax=Sorangium sp. So ce1153 TaxID=3133333 RepID=UPI003F5DC9B4
MKTQPSGRFTGRPMKSSGVEWLGSIPSQWQVLQTRRICELTTGGRDTQDANPNAEYPFFVRSQTVERIDTYSFDGEGVLTSGDGAGVGKIFHHYVGKFEFHQRVYLYHSFRHVAGRFFYYYLREHLHRVVLAGNAKSTVDSLRRPMLQAFPVLVPPLSEQHAIVSFLDRKTAAIDSLIAKKERLIELLQEKRQALITRAVTKGLDPSVPMKESGIEWLGTIPETWDVVPLRRVLYKIEQGWSPESEDRPAEGDEWAVLKLSSVSRGCFRPEEHKALPSGTKPEVRYEVRAGDLLVTRANTPLLVGDACCVENVPPRLMLPDLIYRLSVDQRRVVPVFVARFLLSAPGRAQIIADARGTSMSMAKVSGGHIRSWLLPVPRSLDEQHRIGKMLDDSCAQIDEASRKIEVQIERLVEYRQGLIIAATTGKIDMSKEAA